MLPTVQELADHSAGNAPAELAFFGARWMVGFGGILLILLLLVTTLRWLSPSRQQGQESVIQLAIAGDATLPISHPDRTAPDPGDDLP